MFDDFDSDPTGFPGQCNFVHKRLFGAAKSFVTSGFNPVAAATGFINPQGGAMVNTAPLPGRFTDQAACTAPFVRDPRSGACILRGSPAAGSVGIPAIAELAPQPGGMDGQLPSARTSQTLVCPPGMVLSKDDRCFHSLPRKDRKWNPGRKPLLTGGERNAITKAAAAARKIQRTEKQLQKLGMLKKPSSRRAPARPRHEHLLTSATPGVEVHRI